VQLWKSLGLEVIAIDVILKICLESKEHLLNELIAGNRIWSYALGQGGNCSLR
jgi:hypothetical protein